jgi:hypothetical protein
MDKPRKLNELICNVQNLVACLNRQRDIILDRHIDQFYLLAETGRTKNTKIPTGGCPSAAHFDRCKVGEALRRDSSSVVKGY